MKSKTYKVWFSRHQASWLIEVEERPVGYIVQDYRTRSLWEAVRYFIACRLYWR